MVGLIVLALAAGSSAPQAVQSVNPPPIVRVQPKRRYGQWTTNDVGDYAEAFTGNESGSVFGVLCGTSCVVYVDFQSACVHGSNYSVMINSPSGAAPVELKCYELEERYILITELSDNYISIFSRGGEIGFAIPMESGKFRVSRFSLEGGAEALSTALDMAMRKRDSRQEGLRDFDI